ncbi:GntR family transcriptional regulator [Herbiconiux moechotypicola]|uniref:GntR family transcriptional regulator n=1 Tax=Herbiconiux moechotypicola TaxID=637393 RepID=A0ABN3DSS6_9MICO|nr:GntR family transcriptional regulator [Herbiconiux moechotypicola]MCS5730583.1 GntR family transcriptional regulator [Herbiconiux moechotypicola]
MMASSPRVGYLITDPPSLTALVADALRNRIVSGDLAPGSRLIEEQLCADFGVSRPPVREALRLLSADGLVELVARRGAVVARFGLADVREIVTLRESLERTALELSVPGASEEALNALTAALEVMERHAEEGLEAEAVADSARFHEALVGLAGHSRLSNAYRAISLQVQVLMTLNRVARRESESLVARAARHRLLVEHIVRGDREAAIDALHGGDSIAFLPRGAIDTATADETALEWLEQQKARHPR